MYVCILQVINVETPEHQSPRVFAYFFMRASQMEDGRWLVNMTIPVHFRYHRFVCFYYADRILFTFQF